jgi:hypothetical protein
MLDTERLPCLATLAPAAAATTHAPVEMLTVPALRVRVVRVRGARNTRDGGCHHKASVGAALHSMRSVRARAPVSAGADNVQHARPRVDGDAAVAHGARQASNLGGRLPLGAQQHQERGRLRRVSRHQQRLWGGRRGDTATGAPVSDLPRERTACSGAPSCLDAAHPQRLLRPLLRQVLARNEHLDDLRVGRRGGKVAFFCERTRTTRALQVLRVRQRCASAAPREDPPSKQLPSPRTTRRARARRQRAEASAVAPARGTRGAERSFQRAQAVSVTRTRSHTRARRADAADAAATSARVHAARPLRRRCCDAASGARARAHRRRARRRVPSACEPERRGRRGPQHHGGRSSARPRGW